LVFAGKPFYPYFMPWQTGRTTGHATIAICPARIRHAVGSSREVSPATEENTMRRHAFPTLSAHMINRLAWLVLAALFLAAVSARADSGPAPKYVFLFIGDGLAMPQRSAAEYVLAARQGGAAPGIVKLAMNSLPVQGLTTTYSLNSIITDSGAAGTALACGVKTYNGAIGVDGDKKPVRSVAEMARDAGMKVGIVSSVSLDHATPASFYAHQASRNSYHAIELDLAASRFDFFGGGGLRDPKGKREKTEGETTNALEAIKAAGYVLPETRQAILDLKPGTKAVAINPELDEAKAMPYALDQDAKGLSLAEFTAKGIELLDNPKGFFFMIEGGKIDWACHANDAVAAVEDTLAMDAAVAEALRFAEKHPKETLVVVTGDHECGGLTLGFAGTRYGNYYEYLKNQKASFDRFTEIMDAYRKTHTAQNASFDDMVPLIRDSFGLIVPTAADLEAMKNAPKPNEDSTSPANPHGMYLKDFELAAVKEAFQRSMEYTGKRPSHESEMDFRAYGGYEPLTIALLHILDNKAGIGWTSYAHTGVPVVTSATGPGAEAFGGYYDNTDLGKRLMAALDATAATVASK
jgi:alkaline phosphatase